MNKIIFFLFLFTALGMVQADDTTATDIYSQAQSTSLKDTSDRILPIGAEWARNQGIDLPLPFGVSASFIYMARDVEVTDVTVQFAGRTPQSISDFASFAVSNRTTVSALRFDAWVLPIVNLYLMAGYTWTNANLNAQFTIDRIILPLPPVEIKVEDNSKVHGPYLGGGATLVAGYKKWFIMADASYGNTKIDKLEGKIDFWLFAARTGWSGIASHFSWRAWLGGMYLQSERTLTTKVVSDVIGEVTVDIHQRALNPWTAQIGGGLQMSKKFELMLELGSNFGDAFIAVFSGSYRF